LFFAIRGNNDGDIVHLNFTFSKLGEIKENYQVIDLEGRKVLMLHGHTIAEAMIDELAKSGTFDLILYGHYHHVRKEKVGKTLVINPGEGCGYLTGKATAAIINFRNDGNLDAEIIEI
jgi:hypothetical protein